MGWRSGSVGRLASPNTQLSALDSQGASQNATCASHFGIFLAEEYNWGYYWVGGVRKSRGCCRSKTMGLKIGGVDRQVSFGVTAECSGRLIRLARALARDCRAVTPERLG